MAIGNKTVGQDIRVVINTINGVLNITPDLVGEFKFTPVSDWKDWLPVSGFKENAVLPNGHQGTISLIRKNPIIEKFWADFEAAYYQGQSLQYGSITETIKESDGSLTQWLYSNVIFKVNDFGTYKGNEFVMQEMEWRASSRIQL